MALQIPIIGALIDGASRLLGIGEKVIERTVVDKNKAQDQRHERSQTQAGITLAGEQNTGWTIRKIAIAVFLIPPALNFAVKPTVEWVAAVFGYKLVLPGIDVAPSLKILLGLFGLELGE